MLLDEDYFCHNPYFGKVSATLPKPILCVMPLRKINSETGCFCDVDMLVHNTFFQKMHGIRACFPSWSHSSQVCSRLLCQAVQGLAIRLCFSDWAHRHRDTHTHTYLYKSIRFKTRIIAKPIRPNPSDCSILVCQFFIWEDDIYEFSHCVKIKYSLETGKV